MNFLQLRFPPAFRLTCFATALGIFLSGSAIAAPAVSLMTPDNPTLGWKSDNGAEFPGAKVNLAIDPGAKREGRETLKLTGDFTNGGNYVQMSRNIEAVDIRELSMWLKSPDMGTINVRLVDSSGQCHQIVFKIKRDADWQKLVLPIDQFFAKMEVEGATPVAKYEYWGGAKDGKWHGPAKSINLLLGKNEDKKLIDLWVNDVAVTPKPASAGKIATTVPIAEIIEGETDWTFDNGQEFKGATGSLKGVKDQPAPGQSCMELTGDFSKGGNYVQCMKDLPATDLGGEVARIRMKVKSDNVSTLSVRLIDSTNQCHQARVPVTADGQWHEMVLQPEKIAGGEHWGGANDGKWHGPATKVALIIGASDDRSTPKVVDFADVQADVMIEAFVQASSFKSDFEGIDKLPADWITKGNISIDAKEAFKGTHSLLFDRPPELADVPSSAVSPAFKVTAGTWDIALACKSDLKSPDASFNGVVTLEPLDAAGKVIAPVTLADIFGKHNWQPVTKRVEMPQGAVSAQFRVVVNKAVGQFRVDEISASFIAAAARKDNRIERLVLTTAALGNLLYPEDKRIVNTTVEATKPLEESQLAVSWHLRDYWGAELTKPATISLARKPGKNKAGRYVYEGSIDLDGIPLEVGRYYEIHAEIPRKNEEPYRDRAMFAIVPEALTNSYKPEEIPFTGRDWDNRITEHFYLTHRMGIRIAGAWGGWSAEPPYKPNASGIELCEKLGMGMLIGAPSFAIEHRANGWEKYDEKALREGAKNLVTEFGKRVHPLIIDLGNEPHESGPGLQDQFNAYRYIYEGAKAADPDVIVLATSVPATDAYFEGGYGKSCDVYDFHVYEAPENVKGALDHYKEMSKKYGVQKPIWSTEIGLNCQGMARHVVAIDMMKKFAIFFANGGTNLSWFDLFYPDSGSTRVGSSTEAFDVFEGRYSRYSPKLTAIVYYDLVNAIAIKKFVSEKQYGADVHAYLFRDRDNRDLQILWKDKGRQDTFLPLPGAKEVEVVRLDGSRNRLNADGKGITLTLDEDPVMLLYTGTKPLADELQPPAAKFTSTPSGFVRGAATDIALALDGIDAAGVELTAPPFWDVKKTAATVDNKPAVRFTITSPASSAIREADLTVSLKDAKGSQTGVLFLRPPVTGQFSVKVLPEPKGPAVKLAIKNNGTTNQDLDYEVSLLNQIPLANGRYELQKPVSPEAYFTGSPKGTLTVTAGQTAELNIPLAGVDPLNVYKVRTMVSDQTGRSVAKDRYVGGFMAVPKAGGGIKPDGMLDEPDWQRAPVAKFDQQRQVFDIDKKGEPWKGPADLSATLQYLWDDKYLYVGVKVTDDKAGALVEDGQIWQQDGLQFLIDPSRAGDESLGKYDYAVAVGKKGPQAWCYLSADSAASTGEVKDFTIGNKRGEGGSITYEIAIPWSRLAPFKPGTGNNLGFTIILNEDDGNGRHSFMTWFGNAHTKDVTTVGDLILTK